ncbi:tetratricopeptide repeat protein [Flavilitoribacter nigricans]|uniref:tetratricopeptide repeat protein n=1 Tax=Flavilitoribacter nigricans TaxID=70997 RepID=UPI0014757AE5|nr:tetratricopeptide repeat protein [Flavilitoribacter nigricans]
MPILLTAQSTSPITLKTAPTWEARADSLAETPALDSAIRIRQQLQALYRESEAWEAFAAGGVALATYHFYGGNLDKMLGPLNEVIAVAAPQLDERSEALAGAYQTKAEVFHYVYGSWDSSLVYMEKAIPILENLDRSETLVSCLLLNANNRVKLARWMEIPPDLKRAEKRMQQLALSQGDARWGELYNLYGVAYRQLEQYELALNYQLLTIAYTEPDYLFASYLNNLADLYEDRSDWGRAAQYYERSLGILENAENAEALSIANVLNNLCIVRMRQGELQKAIEYGSKNLKLLEQSASQEVVKRLIDGSNNLALAYLEAGQADNALQVLQEAEAIHQTEPYHQEFTWHNLSHAYRSLGRYDDAIRYMQQSITAYEEMGRADHPLMAKKFRHMGTIFAMQGDFEQALSYYDAAFRLPVGNVSNLDSLKLLRDKGLALIELSKAKPEDKSRLNSALEHHLQAIKLAERLRREHFAGSAVLFAQDTFPVYERSADVAFWRHESAAEPRSLQPLFQVSERARMAQKEEAAISTLRSEIATLPDTLQGRFNDLEINIQFYREQIRNEMQKTGSANSDKVQGWRTDLQQLEREKEELLSPLAAAQLANAVLSSRQPPRSLEEIQAYLEDEVLLIYVVAGEQNNYLLGIHPQKTFVEKLDKAAPPATGIKRLLDSADDPGIRTLVISAPETMEHQKIKSAFPNLAVEPLAQSSLGAWLEGRE